MSNLDIFPGCSTNGFSHLKEVTILSWLNFSLLYLGNKFIYLPQAWRQAEGFSITEFPGEALLKGSVVMKRERPVKPLLIHHFWRTTKIIAALSSFSYILPDYWIDNVALTQISSYICCKLYYLFPLQGKATGPFQTQETTSSLVFLSPAAARGCYISLSLGAYYSCRSLRQRHGT